MALWSRRYPIVSLFWYSLNSSVLLPRRLGYKEYLRIFSDILLPRKFGYKKYFKIFSDILYTRACEVGGKDTFLRQPVLKVFLVLVRFSVSSVPLSLLLKILKRRDNSSQIFCLSLEWHYFCRGVYENGIVPCHQPTDIFNHIIHQSNEDSKDSCS